MKKKVSFMPLGLALACLSCMPVASCNASANQEATPPDTLQLAKQGNYMTLMPTGQKNALGNPLYKLRLYVNGQEVAAYDTVSGRPYSQNRNRHKSGTEAPLPDGQYTVAKSTVPSAHPEVGRPFLPIKPLFRTGRDELGIHYDPSFEKDNGEDGTSGCIALKNEWELYQVLDYVRTYQPEYLEVNIIQ